MICVHGVYFLGNIMEEYIRLLPVELTAKQLDSIQEIMVNYAIACSSDNQLLAEAIYLQTKNNVNTISNLLQV